MNDTSISESIVLGLGGIYGYFANLDYQLLFALMLVMALDIVIGVIFAMINGEFASYKMKNGLLLKMALLLLLLALTLFQVVLDTYGITVPFGNMITGMLMFMEISSILETFAKNDVILPKKMLDWFEQTKNELNE